MNYEITPKLFEYKGYECEIKKSPIGLFGLGYVKLPKEHKYYGLDCDNIPIKCHGGLTYSKPRDDKWIIGFDCGHAGDLVPFWKSTIDNTYIENLLTSPDDIFRDNEFIENEIKRIIDQF